jgi:uncharacterized protein YjgD (DUF1641 family)
MQVNGSPNWQETEAGRRLQETLAGEKTLQSLDHLLQRIDTLEKAVEKLTTLIEQGPGIVAMVADMADDGYRQAANRGVDIDQRLKATLEIAEKLTAPEMIEKLESALKLADQAPGIMAMMVDMFDEGYKKTLDNGIDIPTLSKQGIKVTKSLSNLVDSEEFEALLNSGVFNPKALDVLSVVSGALIKCRMNPPQKASIFQLLFALRDPEIKKSLGFLLSFARNFGNLCNEVVEKDLQKNKIQ